MIEETILIHIEELEQLATKEEGEKNVGSGAFLADWAIDWIDRHGVGTWVATWICWPDLERTTSHLLVSTTSSSRANPEWARRCFSPSWWSDHGCIQSMIWWVAEENFTGIEEALSRWSCVNCIHQRKGDSFKHQEASNFHCRIHLGLCRRNKLKFLVSTTENEQLEKKL